MKTVGETEEQCAYRVLWKRLDEPGWESVCLQQLAGGGWEADAHFVGSHGGQAVAADFRLILDDRWVTLRLEANWGLGPTRQSLVLDRVGTRWRVNGQQRADLDGCIDVDIGWTPLTNTLPIRRLGLADYRPHEIAAAWIRPGTLEVGKMEQRYTRTGPDAVQFEAPGSGFVASLQVDGDGLVLDYPGLFRRLA